MASSWSRHHGGLLRRAEERHRQGGDVRCDGVEVPKYRKGRPRSLPRRRADGLGRSPTTSHPPRRRRLPPHGRLGVRTTRGGRSRLLERRHSRRRWTTTVVVVRDTWSVEAGGVRPRLGDYGVEPGMSSSSSSCRLAQRAAVALCLLLVIVVVVESAAQADEGRRALVAESGFPMRRRRRRRRDGVTAPPREDLGVGAHRGQHAVPEAQRVERIERLSRSGDVPVIQCDGRHVEPQAAKPRRDRRRARELIIIIIVLLGGAPRVIIVASQRGRRGHQGGLAVAALVEEPRRRARRGCAHVAQRRQFPQRAPRERGQLLVLAVLRGLCRTTRRREQKTPTSGSQRRGTLEAPRGVDATRARRTDLEKPQHERRVFRRARALQRELQVLDHGLPEDAVRE
mmetsp:Transcript_19775/g.78750  ORF Transcript_19775/g.78750 Transcript_19775/m.78750 type:complete len:398 (+) Transcript_19775:89-1282(+)